MRSWRGNKAQSAPTDRKPHTRLHIQRQLRYARSSSSTQHVQLCCLKVSLILTP